MKCHRVQPMGRVGGVEGRWGDSKERKGEKEGKERERKVDVEWESLHKPGLPGAGEQRTVPVRSLHGLVPSSSHKKPSPCAHTLPGPFLRLLRVSLHQASGSRLTKATK